MEMYTEDWLIAHRRWVWLRGSSGQRVERSGLSPLGHSSCLSARAPRKGSWTSLVGHGEGGWPCRHHTHLWVCLDPCRQPALLPPRYQHLSAAYSPITPETQRERQKGLTRQVFEQDTSGDERSGPEDSVREPGACVCVWGGCRLWPQLWSDGMGSDPNGLEPERKCVSPVS